MQQLIANNSDIVLRLGLALGLGMIIGVERVLRGKSAGMRTYAMVSMGSALFVIISEIVRQGAQATNVDALRMASNIIVGVGFLGSGLIVLRGQRLVGLTTASGLWVSAGIGVAAGFGFFNLAVIATVLTIFIFAILFFVEEPLKKISHKTEDEIE
ncbi:MAG TPA: MgtC/SapB family protein [Candidatus Paceibacterota bacterium]